MRRTLPNSGMVRSLFGLGGRKVNLMRQTVGLPRTAAVHHSSVGSFRLVPCLESQPAFGGKIRSFATASVATLASGEAGEFRSSVSIYLNLKLARKHQVTPRLRSGSIWQ